MPYQYVELLNTNISCQKSKFRESISRALLVTSVTCLDIKYVRLRHKTKFWNLILADFRHLKMYFKPLANLSHMTRQVETYAPPSSTEPLPTEVYLYMQNIYQINNRVSITSYVPVAAWCEVWVTCKYSLNIIQTGKENLSAFVSMINFYD